MADFVQIKGHTDIDQERETLIFTPNEGMIFVNRENIASVIMHKEMAPSWGGSAIKDQRKESIIIKVFYVSSSSEGENYDLFYFFDPEAAAVTLALLTKGN